MSTIQECLQKAIDLANQVDTNTQNIAALDVRVSALEGVTPPPEPPSPSPSPEPQPPTPPSPSPSPEPPPPDENPAISAARIRNHFLPGSVVVNPGTQGRDIEGALATGRAELDLGSYPGDFSIKDSQSLVGIPYGSRCQGKITIENGAHFLLRGAIADGRIEFAGGDEPTSGSIELTVGNISGTGVNLQDVSFVSCDGQHDFQDARMKRVEFARAKSHNGGISPQAPCLRIHGRSRADVDDLVIDSYNSLQARDMSIDIQHANKVTIVGVDDESYEDRQRGPASINLVDVHIARVMAFGGNAGAAVDGLRCENVDYLIVMDMGQNPCQGHVGLNISGAKQAWLVACAEMSKTDSGGDGRIWQAKNNTQTASGNVDPALLGDGMPWLGWPREVPEPLPAFAMPGDQPDETEAINAMGSYVRLEDRPYRCASVALTGGRIFRGGPNTVLYNPDGGSPVIYQQQGSGQGMPTTSGAILLDVRLHGGSQGLRFSQPNVQCTNMVLSGVNFSGQSDAGILVHNTYAIDNCVSRCVTFDGPCSLKQRSDDTSGTGPTISYIDKWFWDRAQFFGASMSLQTTRASNMNVWRKGYSENCAHRIQSGYNYTCFVGHSFKESSMDTDLNAIFCVDCDVTLSQGNAFGFGTLLEGASLDLRGDAKPFMTAIPLQWQLYYINAGTINCVAPNTDPEYVNTPAGTPGISLFSAMSTWKGGSPWQGPKLRVSSLDTKGSNDMGDDVRTNQNVIE